MKNIIKRITTVCTAFIMVMVCSTQVFAATKITSMTDSIYGVVWILGSFNGSAWSGTGFAIGDPSKPVEYIVTNAHVVTRSGAISPGVAELKVYFSYAQNNYAIPSVYKIDEERDIAVLKLPAPTTERTALVICPSSDINTGDEVAVVGYPGVSDEISVYHSYDTSDVTITSGVISKKTTSFYHNNASVYQTNAEINHGNSGGPLVNTKGEVVGINTFTFSPDDVKLNYSVCIDELLDMVSREQVGYVLSTDKKPFNPVPIIIIAAIVLVAGGAAVVMKKKVLVPGNSAAPAAYAKPSAPAVPNAPSQQAVSTKKAVIRSMSAQHNGKTFPVGKAPVVIGRDPSKCVIIFKEGTKGVSGVHCSVSYDSETDMFTITDLGSTYGTYLIGGQQVLAKTSLNLRSGDSFYVGDKSNVCRVEVVK